ncbi:MAG: hypothetical protein K5705_03185 [Oscillospiraceae bacterium]|nr:hypothetical protein [Oscillospiraceae bacterium]
MLCPDCKTKVPDKYTYCPKCGASIPLYRMDQHSFNRFIPIVCSVLAIGSLGTVAYLNNVRTREQMPQTVAEEPAAQSSAPEESAAPADSSAGLQGQATASFESAAPEPAPEMPALSSAVVIEHVALRPDRARLEGDVNSDGCVDVTDAQLVLSDYVNRLSGLNALLTEEQRSKARVTGDPDGPSSADAQLILRYYAACLSDPDLCEVGIRAWYTGQEVI